MWRFTKFGGVLQRGRKCTRLGKTQNNNDSIQVRGTIQNKISIEKSPYHHTNLNPTSKLNNNTYNPLIRNDFFDFDFEGPYLEIVVPEGEIFWERDDF